MPKAKKLKETSRRLIIAIEELYLKKNYSIKLEARNWIASSLIYISIIILRNMKLIAEEMLIRLQPTTHLKH